MLLLVFLLTEHPAYIAAGAGRVAFASLLLNGSLTTAIACGHASVSSGPLDAGQSTRAVATAVLDPIGKLIFRCLPRLASEPLESSKVH